MAVVIKLDFDDDDAEKSFEELADVLRELGADVEDVSEEFDDLEDSTKDAGKESANFTGKIGDLSTSFSAGAVAVVAFVEGLDGLRQIIVDSINRTNLLSDALIGAAAETGRTADELTDIAQQLREASSETLTLTTALQNLTLGAQAGFAVQDQIDLIEFATLKAKQLGADTEGVVQTLTGAIIGASAEQLQALGVLPGGIEAIRNEFDELRGQIGLFDNLSEEQRKMFIRVEALKNIRDRTDDLVSLGLDGQNSMDQLAGAAENAREGFDRLVAGTGVQGQIEKLANTINILSVGFDKIGSAATFVGQVVQRLNRIFLQLADVLDFLAGGDLNLVEAFDDMAEASKRTADAQQKAADQAVIDQNKAIKAIQDRRTNEEAAAKNLAVIREEEVEASKLIAESKEDERDERQRNERQTAKESEELRKSIQSHFDEIDAQKELQRSLRNLASARVDARPDAPAAAGGAAAGGAAAGGAARPGIPGAAPAAGGGVAELAAGFLDAIPIEDVRKKLFADLRDQERFALAEARDIAVDPSVSPERRRAQIGQAQRGVREEFRQERRAVSRGERPEAEAGAAGELAGAQVERAAAQGDLTTANAQALQTAIQSAQLERQNVETNRVAVEQMQGALDKLLQDTQGGRKRAQNIRMSR